MQKAPAAWVIYSTIGLLDLPKIFCPRCRVGNCLPSNLLKTSPRGSPRRYGRSRAGKPIPQFHTPSPSAVRYNSESNLHGQSPVLTFSDPETKISERVSLHGSAGSAGLRRLGDMGLVRGGIRGWIPEVFGTPGTMRGRTATGERQTRRGAGPVRKRNFGRLRAVKRLRPFNRGTAGRQKWD